MSGSSLQLLLLIAQHARFGETLIDALRRLRRRSTPTGKAAR